MALSKPGLDDLVVAGRVYDHCTTCDNVVYEGFCQCDDRYCDDPSCLNMAEYRLYIRPVWGRGLTHTMTCQEHLPKFWAANKITRWVRTGFHGHPQLT